VTAGAKSDAGTPGSDQLTRIEKKLDEVLAFTAKLEPHLPLLTKAGAFLHNPATAWRRNRAG
jgi:hypothetical protein